jgi:HK97 family phage prohead protease
MERKMFPLELKSLKERQFEGYLSTFSNVDHGGDIVVRGAFKKTLSAAKKSGGLPPMFWMHQWDKVPGKWLDMSEDDSGLWVKGELAPTPLGDEMHTLLGMKAVRGMSIGYMVKDRDWDKEGHRLLKEIDLLEGSIVSLAMNPMAKIEAVKSRLSTAGEYVPQMAEFKRDLENHLRDVGISQVQAKNMVSKMVAAMTDEMSARASEADHRDDDADETLDPEAKEALEALESLGTRFALASFNIPSSFKR